MRWFAFCLLVAPQAHATPPISEVVNDIFSDRKAVEAVELSFRHQVQVKEGEFMEVTEHFTGFFSGGVVLWQMAGAAPVYADWNGKDYAFRNGKTVPSRTGAFIGYFTAPNGSAYLDRLLRERFIRRDQLLQFKPGYQPQGDPKTWKTSENILPHDDIFYEKLGKVRSLTVIGMSEADQKRLVTFAVEPTKGSAGRGIQRLEWNFAQEKAAWIFSGFVAFAGLGRLPKVFSLQLNSLERVRSTLASARAVKRDFVATTRLASKQPSAGGFPGPSLEDAIRLIVRYR